MGHRPVIFISAVSQELLSARELVSRTLQSFGIGVETQETSNALAGDLRSALREKIDRCHGLIQLVGQQYGFEPPNFENPLDPYSYTQFEARYALERKLNPWFLILAKGYAPDNATDQTEDAAALQSAWRARIRKLGHVYENVEDPRHIENLALRIAHEINKTRGPDADSGDAFSQLLAKVEQALAQLASARSQATQTAPQEDPGAIEARAYAALENRFGLEEGILATEIPRLAERLLDDPTTPPIERAQAFYAEKKYAAAEAAALQAKAEALRSTTFSPSAAMAALDLAAAAAREQISYARAIEHLRAAAVFIDPRQDVLGWAYIQHHLAYLLRLHGRYGESEKLFFEVTRVYEDALGPEHLATLTSRNNRAIGLSLQGKYIEAEQEQRALLAIKERVLGPEHMETLASRTNLANALSAQGKYEAAEQELGIVLAIEKRVLGPEHPITLLSRSNLACTLNLRGQAVHAEEEHRAIGAIRERIYGPEHPDTLASWMHLAQALYSQRKYVDAEQKHRAVFEVKERVLGPEHPETLVSRVSLAHTLDDQGKFASAEQEYRAAMAGYEHTLGPESLSVFQTCYHLAISLNRQNKYQEASAFAQRAIGGYQQYFGQDHQAWRDAVKLRDKIETAQRDAELAKGSLEVARGGSEATPPGSGVAQDRSGATKRETGPPASLDEKAESSATKANKPASPPHTPSG